jgi:heat shock protein 1/8
VPAYFNDSQRQATKDAGQIAGLNVVRIINEPTAAAIAYGMERKTQDEKTVLIFDLGGGTFDVSVLVINNGNFKVKSIAGDTHLGGEDFDNRLLVHFIQEFMRKHKTDISGNNRALRRLRTACERAKRALSSAPMADIEIDSLADGIDFYSSITAAKFEEMCADLFEMMMGHVKAAVDDCKLEIDEIVLVGGSSRIPKIQELLKERFKKELNTSIDPEEAVGYGAAVHAAVLNGDTSFGECVLQDVVPLSLGIDTAGGVLETLVERNTPIPVRMKKIFSTYADDQESVVISVYEGERPLAKDNHLLGKFDLLGIPPAPRGIPKIEVKFDVDVDGILGVSAIDFGSGKHERVTIRPDKGGLSAEEVARMVEDARRFESEDFKKRDAVVARNDLESYVLNLKNTLERFKCKLSQDDIDHGRQRLGSALQWVADNKEAEGGENRKRKEELRAEVKLIVEKIGHKEDKEDKSLLRHKNVLA